MAGVNRHHVAGLATCTHRPRPVIFSLIGCREARRVRASAGLRHPATAGHADPAMFSCRMRPDCLSASAAADLIADYTADHATPDGTTHVVSDRSAGSRADARTDYSVSLACRHAAAGRDACSK